MNLWEYLKLFFLNLQVKKRLFVEYLRVIWRYYGSAPFRRADLALLRHYFFQSPYKISKEFLLKAGEADVYTYGETPLTTLERIARECRITKEDTLFELGSGRGRGCLWFSCFLGCRAVGIEYIPAFVAKANLVKEQLHIENVEFRLGDIREADYQGATVLYLYGTCFDDTFLKKLMERLTELPEGAKVITVSYPLTDYFENGEFIVAKQFEAPFIWGTADVFLHYRRAS